MELLTGRTHDHRTSVEYSQEIAAHVRDKQTDPAVICIDELGTYVILCSQAISAVPINGIADSGSAKNYGDLPLLIEQKILSRYRQREWFVIDNIQHARWSFLEEISRFIVIFLS